MRIICSLLLGLSPLLLQAQVDTLPWQSVTPVKYYSVDSFAANVYDAEFLKEMDQFEATGASTHGYSIIVSRKNHWEEYVLVDSYFSPRYMLEDLYEVDATGDGNFEIAIETSLSYGQGTMEGNYSWSIQHYFLVDTVRNRIWLSDTITSESREWTIDENEVEEEHMDSYECRTIILEGKIARRPCTGDIAGNRNRHHSTEKLYHFTGQRFEFREN